ncbi:MAG: hypothetical protein IIA67_02890 [Planctomycetes bacterium]|nr:hypothetical protein [Planctomycetota bacterium]
MTFVLRTVLLGLLVATGLCENLSAEPAKTDKSSTWRATLVDRLASGPKAAVANALRSFPDDRMRLEIVADWIVQDKLDAGGGIQISAIDAVVDELGTAEAELRVRFAKLRASSVAKTDRRWAELYLEACQRRRIVRLKSISDKLRQVVFTKHYDMGGSHYAYTEGLSDAQSERHFKPAASLCLLTLGETPAEIRTLLDDRGGVIRDPDVSFDGRRILFAWKKSLNKDDYHLYEMTVATGKIRQITFGLGFADYEGAYLPGGDIVFNSTRCVQTVDCWWTEVSNLYPCDPQGLFQMNPDGTAQRELYGNSSWFPTSLLHPRAIPGTQKVMAIFTGHHTRQRGWLGIIDPARGRQENSGAQLIAPVRDTPVVRIDRYGQTGGQFQYPYPLSETEFFVTFRPQGARHFGIYFMSADGRPITPGRPIVL